MPERIESDAAETPSGIVTTQPRDIPVRGFMERNGDD
jgi:hypothetical protein